MAGAAAGGCAAAGGATLTARKQRRIKTARIIGAYDHRCRRRVNANPNMAAASPHGASRHAGEACPEREGGEPAATAYSSINKAVLRINQAVAGGLEPVPQRAKPNHHATMTVQTPRPIGRPVEYTSPKSVHGLLLSDARIPDGPHWHPAVRNAGRADRRCGRDDQGAGPGAVEPTDAVAGHPASDRHSAVHDNDDSVALLT